MSGLQEYKTILELSSIVYNAENMIDGEYAIGMFGNKYKELDEIHSKVLKLLNEYIDVLGNIMIEFNNTYSFDEIKSHIVGSYSIDDYFTFTIYSNFAPSSDDIINIDGNLYEVEYVTDSTTDDERDEGLSYSLVFMQKM